MVNQNRNKKIIFTRGVSSILDEILKKYKLEKNESNFLNILEQGGDLPDEIILDAVIEVAQGRTPQKNLPSILQERLGVSKPQANKLTKDIEEKLLPLTGEVPEEEVPEKETLERKEGLIMRESPEETLTPETEKAAPSGGLPVERPPQKERLTEPEEVERSQKPPKEDAYRESVE